MYVVGLEDRVEIRVPARRTLGEREGGREAQERKAREGKKGIGYKKWCKMQAYQLT